MSYPNGAVVPADTPEVQAAKAAHLTTAGLPLAYAGHPYAAYPGYPYAAGYPYAVGYPQGLVAHANGAIVPIDEPAVQAAKADHAAAGGAIAPVAAYAGYPYAAGFPYAVGYPQGLVSHANGAIVPVDEPAVQAAKAEHAAAGGAIAPVAAYAGYPAYAFGYPGYPGLVGHPNGAVVPAEPADVAAARADHLAAVAEAVKANN